MAGDLGYWQVVEAWFHEVHNMSHLLVGQNFLEVIQVLVMIEK